MSAAQDELFAEWRKECPTLITDGIVDETKYNHAPIKILYLLKEANGGESWDLRTFLAGGGRPATWDNIARWTYGIYHHEEEIPWDRLRVITAEQRREMLQTICAVNLKKTSGGHTADPSLVEEAARRNAERLRKQIETAHPELMILCGTDGAYFREVYRGEPNWSMTSRGIWYVREKERITISYSHPEARTKDCLLYYGIVDAVREILRTAEGGGEDK